MDAPATSAEPSGVSRRCIWAARLEFIEGRHERAHIAVGRSRGYHRPRRQLLQRRRRPVTAALAITVGGTLAVSVALYALR
jgi:hypothetical protein